MPMRPAAPNAQQVNSFESQQQLQAQRDAEARQHQQELAAALQQLQQTRGCARPGGRRRTADDRRTAVRDLWRQPECARSNTSEMSQAQAEAKQKELAKEKQQQDAINSDTVAIDFEHTSPAAPATVTAEAAQGTAANAAGGAAPANSATVQSAHAKKADSKAERDGRV